MGLELPAFQVLTHSRGIIIHGLHPQLHLRRPVGQRREYMDLAP